MDEERKTWVWGRNLPPIETSGEPVTLAAPGKPLMDEGDVVQARDIFGRPFTVLAPGKPLMDTAMHFGFFTEGVFHEVVITGEEMQALQRVARAQLEIEAKRGGR